MPSDDEDITVGLLGRAPADPRVVRQVASPPAARRLSTLSHIDYEDAFLVQTGRTLERTAEQWAHAILDDAPISTRTALLLGWSSLGLRLSAAGSDRHVLGWRMLSSTPDLALLGAGSRVGLPAQLFVKRQGHTLLFCTFVQMQNEIARTMWSAVEPVHRRVVPHVLEQASIRARRGY